MVMLNIFFNQSTSLYKMEKSQVISKEFKKCLFSVMVLFFAHFLNDSRKELEWLHINRLLKARKKK